MFNFQLSQISQKFEQLADLFLKYPKVYATSNFDVGKINSPLSLPQNLMQFSKNNEQVKF